MTLEIIVDGQTLDDVDVFSYAIRLNDVNTCEFSFAGTTTFDRARFANGNEVQVLRDGVLDFLGDIVGSSNFIVGQTKVRVQGREVRGLGKQPIDTSLLPDDGVYEGVQSSTIYGDIVGQSTIFSINTVESSVSTDFKVNKSSSLYNALKKLAIQLGQEIEVDYINLEINIRDALGSSDVFDYKENNNISAVKFDSNEPQAKKVIVYGQGQGTSQIVGSAQAGGFTPGDRVEFVTDLNIKTTAQANTRAAAELAVLEQDVLLYDFQVNNFNDEVSLGDSGFLDAPSAGVDENTVRILEVRRGTTGDAQLLSLQVANAEYNRLIKQRANQVAALNREINAAETSDNTGVNGIAFANAYNVNDVTPLLIPFTISQQQFASDGGVPVFGSFTYDYDIDPFKQGSGEVTLTTDSSVSGTSGNTQPDVTGSTSSTEIVANEQVIAWSQQITSGAGWTQVASRVIGDNYWVLYFYCFFSQSGVDTGPADIFLRIRRGTTTIFEVRVLDDFQSGDNYGHTFVFPSIGNTTSQTWSLELINLGPNDIDLAGDFGVYGMLRDHDHGDGTLIADNHAHPPGSFAVDSADFNAKVEFGDVISDAASVNATEVSIFVEYWNGASWVLKNSILNTGQTIDEGVDISAGGTLPDAFGQWRIRMVTDSNNGDYGQGIVRLTHQIEPQ